MDRVPGWDAKAISDIVKRRYDGKYEKLFRKHDWPERGQDMMPSVQRHVAQTYGSVEAFVDAHK